MGGIPYEKLEVGKRYLIGLNVLNTIGVQFDGIGRLQVKKFEKEEYLLVFDTIAVRLVGPLFSKLKLKELE